MDDGVVIDASVIALFYPELVHGQGPLYTLIHRLSTQFGLAVNDLILAEWRRVCDTPLLNDWITDELKTGRIRMVNSSLPESIRKKSVSIMDSLNLPAISNTFGAHTVRRCDTFCLRILTTSIRS